MQVFGARLISEVCQNPRKGSKLNAVSLCHRTSNCLCFCKTNTKAGISRSTAVASAALQLEDSNSFITEDAHILDRQRVEGVVTLPVEVSPLTTSCGSGHVFAPDRSSCAAALCLNNTVHCVPYVCGTHWHDAGVCGLTKFQTVSNSELKTALCCCAVLLPGAPVPGCRRGREEVRRRGGGIDC